jgi:glycosyltransferase involved in cell wall biosynthesis
VLDPDLRLRMGAAGRHRVQRLYEWKDTVERMLSVYREVTGSLAEPAPMQRPLGRSAS